MRKLIGLGALALAAPLLLSGSPATGAGAVPATKDAFVRYGDGPVRQDSWDQPVQLRFEAREGDLVAAVGGQDPACETIELTGPRGVVAQSTSTFHAIPVDGRYTLRYEQVCSSGTAVGVQLLLGRVVPVRPGRTVRLAADRGYVDIAKVVLARRGGPVVLDADGGPDGHTSWDGSFGAKDLRHTWSPGALLIEAERSGLAVGPDVILEDGGWVPSYSSGLVRPGVARYFYDLGLARTVRLRPLQVDRLRIDGGETRVGPGQTRRIQFRAQEGQWIRVPGRALPRRLTLGAGRTPTSSVGVTPAVMTYGDVPTVPLWRVPRTGRYSLDVTHAESDRPRASYRITLRSLRVRSRTLTTAEQLSVRLRPGRWVVHPVDSRPEDGSFASYTSLRVRGAAGDGWMAVLLGDDDSQGYGDPAGCVTRAGHATEDVFRAEWAVVAPGRRPGAVDLALDLRDSDLPRERCPDRLPS